MNAHWNKSLLLLTAGDLIDGFKEYEWRMKRKEFTKKDFACPALSDQDIFNKKVIVYSEQGLGDAIQFARYLPLLKSKGCVVTLECNDLLYKLFKPVHGIDELVSEDSAPLKSNKYDFNISLLSLPNYFKTTLKSIPANVPYINVPENKKEEWRGKLGNLELTVMRENVFKIGLVWGGNPMHGKDNKRSIPLNDFSIFSSIKGIKVFSLQKGKSLEQIKNAGFIIENLSEKGQETFLDTAAIIENLDLVISVDTSVVHLAGAMGKPVWTLLPYYSDWRWLKDRNDSPWYPAMRLFRQPEPGRWDVVLNNVKQELIQLCLR